MLTQRRYFKWNNENNLSDIKLGDSIHTLRSKNIVAVITKDDELSYRYHNDDDIWIGVTNDLVSNIFFINETGYSILGIDPYSFIYPATDSITEHVSKSFEYLPQIKNVKGLIEYGSGDYLILIFKDSIPRDVFIIRNN